MQASNGDSVENDAPKEVQASSDCVMNVEDVFVVIS